MAEVDQRRAVKRPGTPEDHRSRERERDPLPAGEPQLVEHRERDDRQAQRGGDDEPSPPRQRWVVSIGNRRAHAREAGVVADGLDGGNERRGSHGGGVVDDRGPLRREVDARRHAGELVQRPLDARRARRAGHPVDREVELEGGHLINYTPKGYLSGALGDEPSQLDFELLARRHAHARSRACFPRDPPGRDRHRAGAPPWSLHSNGRRDRWRRAE